MGYKRKYQKGEPITSFDELCRQEYVYFFDKITHREWFQSWQIRLALRYIKRGYLHYAVKVGETK